MTLPHPSTPERFVQPPDLTEVALSGVTDRLPNGELVFAIDAHENRTQELLDKFDSLMPQLLVATYMKGGTPKINGLQTTKFSEKMLDGSYILVDNNYVNFALQHTINVVDSELTLRYFTARDFSTSNINAIIRRTPRYFAEGKHVNNHDIRSSLAWTLGGTSVPTLISETTFGAIKNFASLSPIEIGVSIGVGIVAGSIARQKLAFDVTNRRNAIASEKAVDVFAQLYGYCEDPKMGSAVIVPEIKGTKVVLFDKNSSLYESLQNIRKCINVHSLETPTETIQTVLTLTDSPMELWHSSLRAQTLRVAELIDQYNNSLSTVKLFDEQLLNKLYTDPTKPSRKFDMASHKDSLLQQIRDELTAMVLPLLEAKEVEDKQDIIEDERKKLANNLLLSPMGQKLIGFTISIAEQLTTDKQCDWRDCYAIINYTRERLESLERISKFIDNNTEKVASDSPKDGVYDAPYLDTETFLKVVYDDLKNNTKEFNIALPDEKTFIAQFLE